MITRICGELRKPNSPQINEPIMKWASELNRTFSKEKIQMAKTHEKYLPSLAIKQMQIKTTLRFHHTSVRIAIIKKHQQQQLLARVWGKEPSYSAGGNAS
jgi:hypothetical protein